MIARRTGSVRKNNIPEPVWPADSAGCLDSLELVSPDAVSFHAGLAYTHVFEELGTSTDGHYYTSHWTSSYERTSILQESFAVVGMSIARSYGNVWVRRSPFCTMDSSKQGSTTLYSRTGTSVRHLLLPA
jgi:hypothetical protein